jgi:hypothetical protein
MMAVDFFHVDCGVTLKRIYVFFALEVGSRLRAHPWGDEPANRILDHPEARNLLMDLDDRAATFRFLVRSPTGPVSSPRRSTPSWPTRASTP